VLGLGQRIRSRPSGYDDKLPIFSIRGSLISMVIQIYAFPDKIRPDDPITRRDKMPFKLGQDKTQDQTITKRTRKNQKTIARQDKTRQDKTSHNTTCSRVSFRVTINDQLDGRISINARASRQEKTRKKRQSQDHRSTTQHNITNDKCEGGSYA
jgi:hypothetical protein